VPEPRAGVLITYNSGQEISLLHKLFPHIKDIRFIALSSGLIYRFKDFGQSLNRDQVDKIGLL
jgi:hypothetical protein